MYRRLHRDRDAAGAEHVDVADELAHLAANVFALGDVNECVRLRRDALAIRRRLHGGMAEHPVVVAAANDLAVALEALGTPDEAAEAAALRRGSGSGGGGGGGDKAKAKGKKRR
jgi:alanine racemase